MANTQYVTENRLIIEVNKTRKRLLLYGTPIMFFLCILFPEALWWFLVAFIVFLIIVLNIGSTKLAGAEGENSTLEMLSSLPDSYTILNQVPVPNKESRTGYTELDFIVVGPNGVFVIEVKNNKGEIIGSEEEKEWIVFKVGRKGTPYTTTMKNPIKQLKNQIRVLRNFMAERGHKIWIEGIVFFPNPHSSLQFKGNPSVPIFLHSGLTDYILHYKPKYAPENIDRIVLDLAKLKQSVNV